MLIGFGGGGTTFPLVFDISFFPFGVIGLALLSIAVTYAISKYEFLDIRLAITSGIATILTFTLILASYLLLLSLPTTIHYPLTILLLTLWGLFGGQFRQWLQTGIEHKFIKDNYDAEKLLRVITEDLMPFEDKRVVLEFAGLDLHQHIQVTSVFALLKENTLNNTPPTFSLITLRKEEENRRYLPETSALVGHFNPTETEFGIDESLKRVILLNELPQSLQQELIHYQVDPKSIILPFYSQFSFHGLLILGPKASEKAFNKKDIDFFETLAHHISIIFDRIDQQNHLVTLNAQLHTLNQALEAKVQEAVALAQKHFHQAALSSLVMGISHEIRNPMASILGSSDYVARSFGGNQNLPQNTTTAAPKIRIRKTSAPATAPTQHANNLWHYQVTPEELSWVVDNNPEQAQALFKQCQSWHLLTDTGELGDILRDITFNPTTISIPSEWAAVENRILFVIRYWIKVATLFKFVNVIGMQIPRILAITDNMLKYGISGGGIQKETFTKLDGISAADSELIFNTLTQHRFIDTKGAVRGQPGMSNTDIETALRPILPAPFQAQIGTIAKLIEQTPGAVKKPVQIQHIIQSALSILEGDCRQHKIKITTDFIEPIPTVAGDEHRLQQAFFNILFNAKQAMEDNAEGKTRELSVRIGLGEFQNQRGQHIDGIKIEIQDTGKGMSPDTKLKIFDPFFTTKGTAGGKNVGLGLSILREVIVNHDGIIDVESELGVGTVFRMMLPKC